MSKRIVILKESQLKKVIDKVVSEQFNSQLSTIEYFKGSRGIIYKMPLIKNQNDLNIFTNIGDNLINQSEILKTVGFDVTDIAKQEASAISTNVENRGKTTPYIFVLKAVNIFLHVVAHLDLQPKQISANMQDQILQVMDRISQTTDYSKYLPQSISNLGYNMGQFLSSMSKLVEIQKRKLS
jgi:hypothetical protein